MAYGESQALRNEARPRGLDWLTFWFITGDCLKFWFITGDCLTFWFITGERTSHSYVTDMRRIGESIYRRQARRRDPPLTFDISV